MRANLGRRAPWLALAALVAGVGMMWAPRANADCYSRSAPPESPFYFDLCLQGTSNSSYEFNSPYSSLPVGIGGYPYLLLMLVNDAVLYDLSNPLTPRQITSIHIPWDWSQVPGGGTHGPYIAHFGVPATGGSNFPYGLVPMGEYGWDILQFSATNPHFLGVGYKPPDVSAGPTISSSAIFDGPNGDVYAISQALDKASMDAGDGSIKIYRLRDSSGQLTLNYQTLPVVRTVPVGHSNDGSYANFPLAAGDLFFHYFDLNAKKYVVALVRNRAAVVIDVTNPANAAPVALWNTGGNNDPLFGGSWAFNQYANQVYLFVPDLYHATVHRFSISKDTLTPTELDATPWYTDGQNNPVAISGGVQVAAFGALVALAGDGKKVGYVSLAGGTPMKLQQAGFPWTDLDPNRCPGTSFQQLTYGVSVYSGTDNAYYVSRTMAVNADVVRVDPSCMSTTPLPNFNVTNTTQNSAASCPMAQGSPYPQAAKAFAGEGLLIQDTSGGNYQSVTLDILSGQTSVAAAWGLQQIQPHQATSVAPPLTTPPGDYTVVLTIPGGYSITKVISVCTPHATLTVAVAGQACSNPSAGCSALIGDTVSLGDAGTPASGSPMYLYRQGTGGQVQQVTTTPPSFTADQAGQYTVGVVVPYSFQATTIDCGDPLFTDYAQGNMYFSCAKGTVNAGNGTASFKVEQPAGNAIADSANGPSSGTAVVSQDVTLRFTGRIASIYTPHFLWTDPPASKIVSCFWTNASQNYTGSTCIVRGLATAAQQPWGLTVQVCQGGGQDLPCTAVIETLPQSTVNITQTDFTFSFSATSPVPVGQDIVITLSNIFPAGAFNNMTFTLPANITTCDGLSSVMYTCATPVGNQCVNSGQLTGKLKLGESARGQNVLIAGSGLVGSFQVSATPASATVAVAASGGACVTCDTPSPAPAPTSATVTGASVTLTWSASNSSNPPVSYSVMGSFSAPACQGTSGTNCTVDNLANGTYTWSVRASNGCGNYADSSTSSFTVTGGGTSTLTITPDKYSANQGDVVTFTFSPAISVPGDQLSFNFGEGPLLTLSYSTCQLFGGCSVISHTYSSSGSFTVSASGMAGGHSVSGSTPQPITIVNTCAQPSLPIVNFTWTPTQPRVGQVVTFTDTSTNVPTQWLWSFGDGGPVTGPGGSSTLQNPTYTYQIPITQPTTYQVTLTATNCRGPAAVQLSLTVLPACDQPEVPTPDFTWSPQGALAQFPQQMQPYVGQTVTFTDTSSNNPTAWKWWDFNQPQPWTPVTTRTTTFTWTTLGDKVVRHQAMNCAGSSPEGFFKPVTVYADVRPVSADFIWTPDPVTTGTTITFTAAQGFNYGDPSVFTWTFDDSPTALNGSSVTHNFACAGQHHVTLTAQRGSYGDTKPKTVAVAGTQCGPDSVQTVDAAKTPGLNGTNWKSDLRIFNPSSQPTSVWIAALPIIADNSLPFGIGPSVLNPHATLVLNDVLGTFAQFGGPQYTKAAIRVTYQNPDGIAPIVNNRTYTPSLNGGTFGQYAPGVPVYVGMTPPTLWITGLRNTGLDQGFRTNYSIANLRGDPGGVPNVSATLYDATGTAVAGTKLFPALQPFGYLQDSVKNLFGAATQTVGTFALKIDVPQGADIQVFASVVDNLTGDPVLIPGVPTPNSPIFIPGAAHLPGVGGTVWRSDLQLTNPDLANPHSYIVEYRPKASDTVPSVYKTVNVAPGASWRSDELIGWIYGSLLPADAQTSGVVHITAPGASTSFPIVQARSYNQTATGTFGQNILPLVAAMGVQTYTSGRKLLLTGMSSQDIARTNVGFVNLSETQGVYFVVYFYDESGNVLNPLGTDGKPMPYELYLDVGGWDQDKLEYRFYNMWKVNLPSNLRAVSAIAQVISGGPGIIYATVIDQQTGDPNFIPAQASQAGMQ